MGKINHIWGVIFFSLCNLVQLNGIEGACWALTEVCVILFIIFWTGDRCIMTTYVAVWVTLSNQYIEPSGRPSFKIVWKRAGALKKTWIWWGLDEERKCFSPREAFSLKLNFFLMELIRLKSNSFDEVTKRRENLHGSCCRASSLPGAEPWSSERGHSDTPGGERCSPPGKGGGRERANSHSTAAAFTMCLYRDIYRVKHIGGDA